MLSATFGARHFDISQADFGGHMPCRSAAPPAMLVEEADGMPTCRYLSRRIASAASALHHSSLPPLTRRAATPLRRIILLI